ncbi:MAG: CocE/NonD family hydrolase, partial [Actinomycetes bacterium]
QTPYGKGSGGSSSPGSASTPGGSGATGGADNYLVQRGYIEVVADVRGTGDSEGSWGVFDPVQTTDGITLVHWAAQLAHSSGKVGTYGPSYLGINQVLLAGAIGKNSPLQAIFPVVAANDIYRDTSFMGGILDNEFDTAYLGLTGALNTANPVADAAGSPPQSPTAAGELANVEAQHAAGLASYHAAFTAETESGGPTAYEGAYYQARNPSSVLPNVVANGIPAYLVGGEFDIFQRGEPMNYAALQNLSAGRPATAPMVPGQKTTGRYQLIDGPWEHLNGSSVDVDPLELEWFDTWLKGQNTGMAAAPTPLHYYDLGTGTFKETTTYPFTGASPTRLYLGAGTLSTTPPKTPATDPLVWTGAGSPCGRPVDQWSIGGISIAAEALGLPAVCASDDRSTQTPPTSSSYTT